MKYTVTGCAWLAVVLFGLQTGWAQQTVQQQYSAAMLGRLGGAHLTWGPRNTAIKNVGLVNVGPTNMALAYAADLPSVTELEVVAFPWQDFDDRGMASIGRMTQLQKLQAIGTRVTDAGMASLSGLKNLQELSIDAPITDAGLAPVQTMTELRLLDLFGTRVTGSGLSALTSLSKLEFLCLDRTRVGDHGLDAIGRFEALRTLLMRGTRVTDAGMASLASHANLERLDLDQTAISDEGVAALAGVIDPQLMTFTGPTQLRSLSLRGARNVRGERLSGVANLYGLPYLQKLDLAETPLGADQAKLAQLQKAEQTVEHWRRLPTVRSIGPIARFDDDMNLIGLYFLAPAYPVSREALDELFYYPPATLRELSLRGATLRKSDERTMGDLEKLAKLTNLQKLNLYNTEISDVDLLKLTPLTNLKQIFLAESDNEVTAQGEQALAEAIPGVQIIRLP